MSHAGDSVRFVRRSPSDTDGGVAPSRRFSMEELPYSSAFLPGDAGTRRTPEGTQMRGRRHKRSGRQPSRQASGFGPFQRDPPPAPPESGTTPPYAAADGLYEKAKPDAQFAARGAQPYNRNSPSDDDYDRKYAPDAYGEELGPTARVWRVYLDESREIDAEMVAGFHGTLDVLLVFVRSSSISRPLSLLTPYNRLVSFPQ